MKVLSKLSIQMKIVTLKTPAIFSFQECLKFLNRSKNECLFTVEEERIRKLFVIDEIPFLTEIQIKNEEYLELVFLNIIPSEEQRSFIKDYIENWLDLKNDLRPFYLLAKGDELLFPLIKKYHGLKLIGIPDFYEAICWAIIGQQINLNFAYSVKRSFVESFGSKFQFEGKPYYHFPGPEKVLLISNQEFIDMKFSRQKVAYIRAISKILVDQTLIIDHLKTLNYEAAKTELLVIYGVGNWTADYVLMKTFRHPQAFPIQDAGLQNALKKLLNLQNKPDQETILQRSKPWKGFEAYATFYLWRSLND